MNVYFYKSKPQLVIFPFLPPITPNKAEKSMNFIPDYSPQKYEAPSFFAYTFSFIHKKLTHFSEFSNFEKFFPTFYR